MRIFLIWVWVFSCRCLYGVPRVVIVAFKLLFSPILACGLNLVTKIRVKGVKLGWNVSRNLFVRFLAHQLISFRHFLFMWGENLHHYIVDLDNKCMFVRARVWPKPLPILTHKHFKLVFFLLCAKYFLKNYGDLPLSTFVPPSVLGLALGNVQDGETHELSKGGGERWRRNNSRSRGGQDCGQD